MTSSTDKLGNIGTDKYDSVSDKVISATRKDGSTVDFVSTQYFTPGYIITAKTDGNSNTVDNKALIPLKIGGNKPTIKSIDGNQHITTTTFNKFGQAVEITDEIGTKKNVYNSRGSLTQTIDELGNATSYNYDERNRVIEIAYGDKLSNDNLAITPYSNSSDKYSTGANLNYVGYIKDLIATKNPDGNGGDITTTYQYLVSSDKNGQIVTKTIDPDGTLALVPKSFSLKNTLGLNTVDKLTVKKLLVGDFNQDDKQDIAIGYSREVFNSNLNDSLFSILNKPTYTNSAGIIILAGDGAGNFTKLSNKVINPTSNIFDNYQFEIADLVAADFDSNGTVDIAAANFIDPYAVNWTGPNNYQLFILSNDGKGNLSNAPKNSDNRGLKPFTSVDYKGLLATAQDINHQNTLVVGSIDKDYNGTTITVYHSDNRGALTLSSTYNVSGIASEIKAVDLNGDGADEIIVNSTRLYIIDVVNSQTKTSAYLTQNTGFWSSMAISDVNKDGQKDIIVANDNSTVKVFLGKSSPTGMTEYNTAPQIYQGTSSPRALIVRDIDRDDKPDIIIGDAFAGYNIKLHVQPLKSSNTVVHKLFEYDSKFGQLTKSVDEEGRVTTYEIDANNGDIKSITQVGNSTTPSSTTRFTYENNTHGLVSTIVDADGNISANNYDDKGRLIGVKQGNTIVSTLTYDPLSGNILTKTDGNNKKTTYEYQTDTNRIKTATYADSLGKTEYVYNKSELLISAINSDGYGQTLEYDELNRVKSTTQLTAKGAITQKMDYDKAGNVWHITNGDNPAITNIYDARHRLIEVDNIDGSTTTYKYDALNNLTKLVDAVGNETEFKYELVANDSRTRLTETRKQIEGGNYLATKATYNNALQVKELTDGAGKKTKYEYDNLGRQIQVTQELDNPLAESGAMEIVNKTTYFDNGNIKTITDGNNHKTTYTYDARNLKSTSTDALGTKTIYGYDDAGNLTSMSTANPNLQGTASITYKYDALNRRAKTIDAQGGTTTTSYDLSGNILTIEDANHHQTKYDYDAANRSLSSTDALGNKTVALYDKLGRIAQLTQKGDGSSNSAERVTNYEYDKIRNTSTVKRPEGIIQVTQLDSIGNIKSVTTTVNGEQRTTAYKYNGLNKLTLIEDALGNTSRFEYDNLGNLTSTTQTDNQFGGIHTTQSQSNNLGWKIATIDGKGQVYTTTYDAVGNVIKQTENGLRTTTNTYDALNRNIQVTTKSGAETLDTYTNYDAVGNVLSRTDAEGHITKYQYDALNRRSKTIDAKLQDTDYTYDAVGNLTEVIDTPTRRIIYTYDALNRRVDIKDAENIVTHTEYNSFGEIQSVTQNSTGINPRTTKYEYDKLGRKVKTIDPLNHSTITEYDEANNIRSVTDANNNRTSYEYDRLNRQTKIIDANNILTQSTVYDGFGHIKSIKDAGGNKTTYEYDELSRLTTTTDPRTKQTIQDYDGLGRVSSIKDRNNHTKTFAYNINDNLLSETWDDGTVISYIYDKVGNLKTSHDGKSGVDNSYDYDAIYQLTSAGTSNSSVKFQYNYDEFGDRLQRQDLVGANSIASLDYTYNNNHQLKYLTQSGTGVITQNIGFAYDKLSQLTQVDRKSASNQGHLITDYAYDSVGRLIDINNQFNLTNISHYGYNYDDGNRLTTKNGTDGNSSVAYGKDNQISAVDNSIRPDEAYNFNALGIRAGWVTDSLDNRRVLNDGKYQYQYDDEGNLTQKKELVTGNLTNYTWDYRNRLTKVTGSQTVEYLYDASDKRVGKKINGTTTEKYVYDGADIALVVDGAGVLVERYLFGAGVDNVLFREKGGAVVWSLGDRQGSVVDLVDGNGAVLNHFVYDSFGGRIGTTGVDFRFGYTGRELDTETGLYYYRARYYDPTMGRFISEDPMGFGAGDPNLYRYVGNSPNNYTDPTGEIANAIAGAGFGAVFGGLYAVANDLETGNFGWNTFGNVAKGAAVGALAGAVAATGVGLVAGLATDALAAGFTAVLGANTALGTATAGAIVNTTIGAGFTAYGAYNAGGNFGRGKYLTGALDLVGVGLGAYNVFTGVTKGIPNARWADLATAIDNLVLPGNPQQLSSSGEIVPVGSSALANRTNVGGAIVPNQNNPGGALVLANLARGALSAATDTGKRGLVYNVDNDIFNSYYIRNLGEAIADNKLAMEVYTRLGNLGVPIEIDFRNAPVDPESGLPIAGEYLGGKITLFKQNTSNQKQLLEYMIHEGVHAERNSGIVGRTMYEEYLAFSRQLIFADNQRPSLQDRKELWRWISQEAYKNLPVGKYPFKN